MVDHEVRNRVQVDEVAVAVVQERIIRQRTAIQQNQRETRIKAEQADRAGARRKAVRELIVLDLTGCDLKPSRWMSAAVIVMTGEAFSICAFGINEPVTMTASNSCGFFFV
jgi:hypothetical protein